MTSNLLKPISLILHFNRFRELKSWLTPTASKQYFEFCFQNPLPTTFKMAGSGYYWIWL